MFPRHATQIHDTFEITVNTIKHEIRETKSATKQNCSRVKSTLIYPASELKEELVSDCETVNIFATMMFPFHNIFE